MKTVIIGGVAGGASAAARLRRLDESAEIIILERGEYVSFANCGLPYYIGGAIKEKANLTLQTPQSFRARFRIDVRVQNEATAIDPDSKTVTVKELATGRVYQESYDNLILSPGAEPVLPDIPGIHSSRVFTLRNIPDTLKITNAIETLKPKEAIVVGGGYIGVEMAENLAHAGLEVTVAELADHVIGPLDYDMACDVHSYLRSKGIRLLLGVGAQSFADTPDGLTVTLSDGGQMQADMVLMSVGVRPDSALAKAAGLAVNKRGAIVTDEHMRTSDPDIYAVGDAVEITDFVTKQKSYVPLAGPANKQGRIAADNICGIPSSYKDTQGSSVLKLFDMTVACTGLNERAAKAAGLSYDKAYTFSAPHATYYPGGRNMSLKVLFEKPAGRILGAQIIGFEGVDKRCDVLATAIRAGMTAADLTELELCYAPPFSSAKDPVNMIGYAIENLLAGRVFQFHWDQVDTLPRDGSVTLLDTRTAAEYQQGHIEGFVNIPLDELRERLGELDPGKPIYLHCQSGLRSYIASRILLQKGFACSHLAGGYRLYNAIRSSETFDESLRGPCGQKV